MAKEYAYKRYQLSLDMNDVRQKPIIEYLDSFTGGKARNGALVDMLINAMNGTNGDIPNSASNMLTEIRLSKIENMLNSFITTMNNKEDLISKVADTKKEDVVENINDKSNQLPGQMFFDDINLEIKDKYSDSDFGSNATESEIVPNIEDNNDIDTLETDPQTDEISKEMVASAFAMPFPSSFDEAQEGIEEDDDIYIPDDVQAFLDSL